MSQKHTLLPWVVFEDESADGIGTFIGNEQTKTIIAHLGKDGETSAGYCKPNAAHIVKCVNMHDELVAALVKIALDLDSKIQAADIEDLSFALNTAKDAIAKARGEA